ncbi:MAG: hypothetical protein QXU67_05030, partial [Candidatus Bathyarchaeia archaeon]
ADFYVDGIYVGSFDTRWLPAGEGWPNPPKNWFVRIVNLPLGAHTLKVTCSGEGCLSIDALGVSIPVGGYVVPSIQTNSLTAISVLLGLVAGSYVLFAVWKRHKI